MNSEGSLYPIRSPSLISCPVWSNPSVDYYLFYIKNKILKGITASVRPSGPTVATIADPKHLGFSCGVCSAEADKELDKAQVQRPQLGIGSVMTGLFMGAPLRQVRPILY